MTIAIEQEDGEFTLKFENGKLKQTNPETTYALHNLLCFGRLNKNLTINPLKRFGWAGASVYQKELFSTAWNYYVEGNITQENITLMINEFNRACDRDYRNGMTIQKVAIRSVSRLDKTTLRINLAVGESTSQIIIKI